MNKSHRCNVASKALDLKEDRLCDSIHVKFKIKQNDSLMKEVRIVADLWWS